MQDESESVTGIRLVICGNSGVGKTNLLKRFITDEFDKETKATVGIDFFKKTVYLGKERVHVQLFDTAGQEKYRSVCSSYYRNSDGVVLVFDVTNRDSYEATSSWLEEIYQHRNSTSKVLLLANKMDLKNNIQITDEEFEILSKNDKFLFYKVSAKENEKNVIGKAFMDMLEVVYTETEQRKKEQEMREFENIMKRSQSMHFSRKSEVLKLQEKSKESRCWC